MRTTTSGTAVPDGRQPTQRTSGAAASDGRPLELNNSFSFQDYWTAYANMTLTKITGILSNNICRLYIKLTGTFLLMTIKLR